MQQIMNFKSRKMKIRPIKNILIIFLILLGTNSCSDYLDVVPDNIAVIEDAFETRENAERFLASLYNHLPDYTDRNDGNPALVAGDEIFINEIAMGTTTNWASHRISLGGQNINSPLIGYWGNSNTGGKNLFIALRDCNIFLENLDKPFDLRADEKQRWIAEAKFLKAYYHFWLMRMYGPIPIIRENIEVSGGIEAVRVVREPVDEVVDYIVKLLDEAIPALPVAIFDSSEFGRISAAAAAAIKARVLVTAASPLFNGNTDYAGFTNAEGIPFFNQTFSDEKWEKAAEACQEAIDRARVAGHDGLYEYDRRIAGLSERTYRKLTIRNSLAERWNKEIIWGATGSVIGNTIQGQSQAILDPNIQPQGRQRTPAFYSPPLVIAEMFYSENGVPIEEDINFDYAHRYDVAAADASEEHYIKDGFETAKLHMNREPRFHASIAFDGSIWFGQGRENESNPYVYFNKKEQLSGQSDNFRYSLTGYLAKKLVNFESVLNVSSSNYTAMSYAFPVVRLSDVYLMYAEALNETGKISEAQFWIDEVRTRAGLDGVVQSWANASSNPSKPATKEGLRSIIQQERMIELVFEGHRFWDLRRWKRAAEFLNKDVLGWNILGKTTTDYYNVIPLGTFRFLSRDYLWPIAETDIVNNDKLIQNPGW